MRGTLIVRRIGFERREREQAGRRPVAQHYAGLLILPSGENVIVRTKIVSRNEEMGTSGVVDHIETVFLTQEDASKYVSVCVHPFLVLRRVHF